MSKEDLASTLSGGPDLTAGGWQPIATAPKDGTEVLGYRADCGVLLMRWTCPQDFLTDAELEGLDEESAEAEDWFYADFVSGGRLDGIEAPTHWMPLPEPPRATASSDGQDAPSVSEPNGQSEAS